MTTRLARLCGLIMLTATTFVAGAQARPLTSAETRFQPFSGETPRCDDPAVLANIQSRFASKEAGYWGSSIELVAFERVRQTGLRNWGMDHIPRRYCQAIAVTNEPPRGYDRAGRPLPRKRTVVYSVIESGGYAGYGFGVASCVRGLDRNLAYAPACRAAGF